MRLAERNDLRESERQQVARYVDGLKLQIRDKISVTVLRSMCEAKNMALRAELMISDKNTRFDSGGRRYGVDRAELSGTIRAVDDKERGVVEKSGSSGEKKSERAVEKQPIESKEGQKQTNTYARPILRKCYCCNQPGHRYNECPNRRAINMVEQEEYENILYDPDGDEEYHEEEYEDHEPSYVIRRLMLTPKQEDNTQRHQLLRTMCMIGGRIFKLIVDRGSSENIISS